MYRAYFENGKLEMEGIYRGGKRDSIWIYWNKEGDRTDDITYRRGNFSGPWIKYYSSGHISVITTYLKNTSVYQINYHENGFKEQEGRYAHGKRDSIWTQWDKKGRIKTKITYKRGKYNGQLTRFYPNGKIGRTAIYKKDSLITETARWDSLGNIIYQFKPVNNYRSGQMIVYYPNAIPKLTFGIKEMLPHGEMLSAHENGNTVVTGKLWKGYRVGKWRFYFPNGKLEKETIYLKNEKVKFMGASSYP